MCINMLLQINDIAIVSVDVVGNGRNEAFAIGAGDQQDCRGRICYVS